MELRQAVDGVREQVLRRVLAAVPLAVDRRVVEPKVGADVDDGQAGADERSAGLRAGGVRQSGEDEVDAGRQLGLDRQVVRREVREDVGELLASLAAAGDGDDVRLWMIVQQASEFGACVPRHVDDSDFDHCCFSRNEKPPPLISGGALRTALQLASVLAIERRARPPHLRVAVVERGSQARGT